MGNLYTLNVDSREVQKTSPGGAVSHVSFMDELFNSPEAVAVSGDGTVFYADRTLHRVDPSNPLGVDIDLGGR